MLSVPTRALFALVVAVIDATTLLLDAALPQWAAPARRFSVNRGISNLTIRDNFIDQTDRPKVAPSYWSGIFMAYR